MWGYPTLFNQANSFEKNIDKWQKLLKKYREKANIDKNDFKIY